MVINIDHKSIKNKKIRDEERKNRFKERNRIREEERKNRLKERNRIREEERKNRLKERNRIREEERKNRLKDLKDYYLTKIINELNIEKLDMLKIWSKKDKNYKYMIIETSIKRHIYGNDLERMINYIFFVVKMPFMAEDEINIPFGEEENVILKIKKLKKFDTGFLNVSFKALFNKDDIIRIKQHFNQLPKIKIEQNTPTIEVKNEDIGRGIAEANENTDWRKSRLKEY